MYSYNKRKKHTNYGKNLQNYNIYKFNKIRLCEYSLRVYLYYFYIFI